MTELKTPTGVTAGSRENGPPEIDLLEADIDRTRSVITTDLRTLGERLSPEHLKEEAKEVMTDAKNIAISTLQGAKDVATSTFREVKEDAMDTVSAKVDEFRDNVRSAEREAIGFVRENAVPLTLIGVGLAWFISNRRSRDIRWEGNYAPHGQGRWRYPEPRGNHPLDDARAGLSRAASKTTEMGQHARDRATEWADGAKHEVSKTAGQVRDYAQRELEDVRGLAHDARERLSDATTRARETAGRELRHAREFSRDMTESHPLAIGVAAVAAGVCVGLLIPETQRESELFGAQRERLLSGAKGALREAKETVEEVTHTAQDTARDLKHDLKAAAGGSGAEI